MSTTVSKMTELQRDWLRQQLEAGHHLPHVPDWLDEKREQAGRLVMELPALDRKTEAWRYTNIEKLFKQTYTPVSDVSMDIETARAQLPAHLVDGLDAYRFVLVNGRFSAELSNTDTLPAGVTVSSLAEQLSQNPETLATGFSGNVSDNKHVFSALNTAVAYDGVFIQVNDNVELTRPIELLYLASSNAQQLALQPRNIVTVGQGASATLIERFVSDDNATGSFQNHLCEITLDRHASLDHFRVQEENDETYHLSNVYISQQAHSHYSGTTLSFGGKLNRTEYHASFNQAHAQCELNGLSIAGDGQLSDFHLNVLHRVPECISRERFKSIVFGKGRAVFDGYIRVDKQAQHSDARLSSDNLLLTRDGEVDTKPQLEIYADDVKCSHGTTVGELDPQQIFYLQSRGIDSATARNMLCMGFANNIVATIKQSALRDYASTRFESRLKNLFASHEVE
jgi:Fe-S cluster assembly protein SufD